MLIKDFVFYYIYYFYRTQTTEKTLHPPPPSPENLQTKTPPLPAPNPRPGLLQKAPGLPGHHRPRRDSLLQGLQARLQLGFFVFPRELLQHAALLAGRNCLPAPLQRASAQLRGQRGLLRRLQGRGAVQGR